MDEKEKLVFASKTSTQFWHEKPNSSNPYLADECRLHGYDLFELTKNKPYVDVLYLLFQGELPNKNQSHLLEQLMIALINPGPRHPAGRAAMTTGICKARPVHILPVSLMVLGGQHLGAAEVEQSMLYLQEQSAHEPLALADQLLTQTEKPKEGDWHIVPGIGSRFGDLDPIPNKLARQLALNPIAKTTRWGEQLISVLSSFQLGWLSTGIAAAILLDLNIKPREGAGLFQLISAPGLLAHGMEQTHQPITGMPFVKDEDYVIE